MNEICSETSRSETENSVVGSDFNAVSSLLYRWWGLFEAPEGMALAPYYEDLFDDTVEIMFGDLEISGRENVIAAICQTPRDIGRAHHIDDENIHVSYLGNDLYGLKASFICQIMSSSNGVESAHGSYNHILRKRKDGKFVFTEIVGELGEPVFMEEFKPSFSFNRAKAVIIQFQTVMDSLSGDASGLREIVAPNVELNGLVSSKEDKSVQQDKVIEGVDELKDALSGADNSKKDSVIRGFAELAEWFATGPDLFNYGHHKMEEFSAKPIGNNRFEVVAQFEWLAETKGGVKIELHQPLTWVVVETGEKYMRIEKLL